MTNMQKHNNSSSWFEILSVKSIVQIIFTFSVLREKKHDTEYITNKTVLFDDHDTSVLSFVLIVFSVHECNPEVKKTI